LNFSNLSFQRDSPEALLLIQNASKSSAPQRGLDFVEIAIPHGKGNLLAVFLDDYACGQQLATCGDPASDGGFRGDGAVR
jgi:hypothetical protein